MKHTAEHLRRLYGPEGGPFKPTYTWKPHELLVHAIAALPGGEQWVSCSEDGSVRVVSLVDGRVVETLARHDGPVNSLCLTPDGARLVTGGDDHTVRVWDTRTWKVQHVLRGHTGYVREVSASDAVIVSGAEDHTVRFWDLASGRLLHVGEAHRENLRTVVISPDGRHAASSGLDNQLIVWDVARGEVLRTLYDAAASVIRPKGFQSVYITSRNNSGRGHRDGPRRLLFLDDGATLLSTEYDALFWDVATGQETRQWPRWGWEHQAIALHPDGRWLALAGNGYVQVRDVATGALVTTLGRGGEYVTALAFTPDGRWLLSGTQEGAVQVWDFAAGLRAEDGCPHQHSITNLVTHGSRALTGDTGGGVLLWDLDVPAPLRRLDVEHEANGRPFALGEGVALTAEYRGFDVWDAQTGELRRARPEKSDALQAPYAMAPLPDGRALVGHMGKGLSLWDLGAGGEPSMLAGDTQQIDTLAVAPDGRHAVSSGYFERPEDLARARRKKDSGYVYVPSVAQLQGWDLEARSLLWTVAADPDDDDSHIDFVFCLFTPDGRLVTRSGANERELAFRNARTGDVVHTIELPGNYPEAARVVGRDLVLLVYDDNDRTDDGWPCTAVRIDLGAGQISRQQPLGRLRGMTASFSPDGSRVAVADLGALDVYDPWTGLRVARHESGPNVRELSFTDDGRRIVLGDRAGRVHVLELAGWEPAPLASFTPEELAALQSETEQRTPPPRPAAAKRKTNAAEVKKSAKKKATVKKIATKQTGTKQTATKKATVKQTATKQTATKQSAAKKKSAKTTSAAKKKSAAKKPPASRKRS